MSEEKSSDGLFELVLYLVSCARLSLDEPVIYGSFRLIEGASRLIDAAEGFPGLEVDAFLRDGREVIEREKLRMIEDHEGYREWLTRLASEFGAEASRRNS